MTRALRHWKLDPFGRTVRAVLAEKRLEFLDEFETPWTPSETLAKADPFGAGPVLEDGDASIIGARAIVEYLEETALEPTLLPSDAIERAEVRRLLDWLERGFESECGAPLRNEKLVKRLRAEGSPDMEIVRPAREALRWRLDYLSWLSERRDWLCGRRMTAADLAAAAHLSSLDYLGEMPWGDFAAAKDWYVRVKSRPAFRAILSDRIPGAPPPAHYADLDF